MKIIESYYRDSIEKEQSAISALLLYALHLRILELPEKERNFYDSIVDLRVFRKKGFSLQRYISLCQKAFPDRDSLEDISSDELLEVVQLLTENVEHFRLHGKGKEEIRKELKNRGLKKQDISPQNESIFQFDVHRCRILKILLKEYGLNIQTILLLQAILEKCDSERIEEEREYLLIFKERYRKDLERIVSLIGLLGMELYESYDIIRPSFRMKLSHAIESMMSEDFPLDSYPSVSAALESVISFPSSFDLKEKKKELGPREMTDKKLKQWNGIFGLKGKYMLRAPSEAWEYYRGPDLSQIYVDRQDIDHQKFCDVARLGLEIERLIYLQRMYPYWLNKGMPERNYDLFMSLFEISFRKYFQHLGYAPEEFPLAFPFPSGSLALDALVSFLPKGEVIMSDREYGGIRKSFETKWGGGAIHTVEYQADHERYLFALRERIRILKDDYRSENVYLLVSELSFDGTVFPVQAIKDICEEEGVVLIVDSCQSIGCMKTVLGDVNILSLHKACGHPPSVGALLVQKKLYDRIREGEKGASSLSQDGTVELRDLGVVSHIFFEFLSETCALALGDPFQNALSGFNRLAGIGQMEQRLLELQKLFLDIVEFTPVLKERMEFVTAHPEKSPGRLSFRVKGVRGEELIKAAALEGVRFSALCGYGDDCEDVVRISFSHFHSDEAVLIALGVILKTLQYKDMGERTMKKFLS